MNVMEDREVQRLKSRAAAPYATLPKQRAMKKKEERLPRNNQKTWNAGNSQAGADSFNI